MEYETVNPYLVLECFIAIPRQLYLQCGTASSGGVKVARMVRFHGSLGLGVCRHL